ncbi:2,3-bisphosphoglycerate-independent phosphoglycerate mutase [bioreactor metagenome]|uniref:2,3-bisphosphoglycerate-independent phosphoglycerate mutase n=1 Tax=bioreactor metagenome TaxID=1076179 RepID=A0A645IDZ1_9ZZZZ
MTNFANGDVIGHTANTDAKIECARIVDTHLGRVIEAAKQQGYVVAITADHGNAEQMLQEDGGPMTAHTTNPVPFLLCGAGTELRGGGRLADIAPTILDVMGLECPPEMDGKTLILK